MAFCDRVLRPESPRVAARQLRRLVAAGQPRFLSPGDRALLRWGGRLSSSLPGAVMPLARRRLRAMVGDLLADATDPALRRHLAGLRAEGFGVNVNLLGEAVLGHAEAARRRADVLALMARPDVDYVSVKVSSVCAQLNLWSYADTLWRTKVALREILSAANTTPPTFVNLDMEEYKDLALTLDAFTSLLDERELLGLEAGIVLQAYLPESMTALQRLCAWAAARRRHGGAGIKVRIVKGANLAAERVEAAVRGWPLAPYGAKAGTDANHKAMLDYALRPEHTEAVSVGVAGHNLFDLAWAHLLAEARGVSEAVTFEMLQGMAPAVARAVLAATGRVVLYTPVVAPSDFDHALAYLFRRLEENAGGDNFLGSYAHLGDDAVFARERARFEAGVARRGELGSRSGRHDGGATRRVASPPAGFVTEPDTDPTDRLARDRVVRALRRPDTVTPQPLDETGVDRVVAAAQAGASRWAAVAAAERADLLERCGAELAARRPQLVALMAAEASKTLAEADAEVSEAVDFARYYAGLARQLERLDGAVARPLGVVAVAGPWNFPLAIPIGGALAALAAGNAAIVKPAPQTPAIAFAAVAACRAAGIPADALLGVRCADGPVGSHFIGHAGIDAIVLTGSFETAELFARLAPRTPLFAETSGKNAMVVMPEADVDQAAADLAHSAFSHAGQKCSAASLAILVGDVAHSARFRHQLVDAAHSLQLGPATSASTTLGPLVEPPGEKLHRALTSLEGAQRWLLEPRPVGPGLWSPGIVDGVAPGDWFARTECFGPVLGLMAAHDLEEALALQNALPYGLTGGIWSLDPGDCERWASRVEVGNAYVNRPITGAIVGRQPFGGWKRSVVGPGAKAGGPNYVLQLCRMEDTARPRRGTHPSAAVRTLLAGLAGGLTGPDYAALEAAAGSDSYWWITDLGLDHDPAALHCESNVLRYRALPGLTVRVAPDAVPFDVARVLVAAAALDAAAVISVHPDAAGVVEPAAVRLLPRSTSVVETTDALAARVAGLPSARVRLVGSEPGLGRLEPAVHVDARPPVLLGRVELLRYLREQTVSRTRHRFGNVVRAIDDPEEIRPGLPGALALADHSGLPVPT
jgi:RHH-type transcriptional regulator, proline utilization regulon repressor / proline dehydrogenase / delta 1-pyrroline-5-carboxylate dehydrogenase